MNHRHIAFLFARRYFASPRSLSVVNIISRVSVFAVGIPVAAMVILLSVFNGFDSMVKQMYGVFDPDLLVVPARGKVFEIDSVAGKLSQINAEYSFLLEENVLLEYRGQQSAARLRGVDSVYTDVVPIAGSLSRGDFQLRFGDMQQAVVGQGIAYDLGIRTAFYDPINVYAVRRGNFSSLLPVDAYNKDFLFPAGIFRLDAETDATFIISSLDFAQELLDYSGMASAIAVSTANTPRSEVLRNKLQTLLGDDFNVLSRYQQKASMYRIMKLEKLGIFIISLFVLIIASFSIIGSLVMLIIDKRHDINILYTMGADIGFVRKIFVSEGMLISLTGTLSGLVLGLLIAMLQQHFGFIKIDAATFLVDAYPVKVQFADVVMIAAAALIITWIINKFTVSKMIPRSSVRL